MLIIRKRFDLPTALPLAVAGMIAIASFGLIGCLDESTPTGPTKNPTDTLPWPVEAAIFHSGISDTLWPMEAASESVYVRGGERGKWSVSILSAPPGTTLSGNMIQYRLPEGLSGPQAVHVIAVKDTSVLESTWTVLAYPVANHAPTFDWVQTPASTIPGAPIRLVIPAHDPDGDPLANSATLPAGATWHDSIFEWTPTSAQAGSWNINLQVTDTHAHTASFAFSITVLGFDPRPFATTFKAGRHWRIRGYTKMKSGYPVAIDDSIQIDRTVTLLSTLSDSGTFSFRVQDTLSGTQHGTRDTIYLAQFRAGFEFSVDKLTGMVPFAWPANATAVESIDFALGSQVFPARREINANTCLDVDHSKYGCGGGERTFAMGWGLVSMRADSEVPFASQVSRDAYDVLEMSDP